MMNEWHIDQKRKFRKEILRILSVRHGQQRSRMDDVLLTKTLRDLAWEVDLNDVITILQEMKQRGWVNFRQIRSIYARGVQLLELEILPLGQDVFDGIIPDPAMGG
jgi:hypothetical protein